MGRKPNNNKEDEMISLKFPDGRCSVRGPVGLKTAIDEYLKDVQAETSIVVTRNAFILQAIRKYLQVLLTARSVKDMTDMLEEEIKFVDKGSEVPIESSMEDANGECKV